MSVNYEPYFEHFEICREFLNIAGYFALSYKGKLFPTGSHFLTSKG